MEPDLELRTFTSVGELLWYNYFPVCSSPTWWVWDLILLQLLLSYWLVMAACCWIWDIFLVGSNLYFPDGCSAVSDSSVSTKMRWALVFLPHHIFSISSRGILNHVRSWEKSPDGCGRKKLNIRKASRIFSIKKR